MAITGAMPLPIRLIATMVQGGRGGIHRFPRGRGPRAGDSQASRDAY